MSGCNEIAYCLLLKLPTSNYRLEVACKMDFMGPIIKM